jgi:hypothetical protein
LTALEKQGWEDLQGIVVELDMLSHSF